ncbi:MAG: HlyC/CorC family transporter, partial [Firmicutes bacterium]|nr:HlyC/CorC family transporter [Bacillota bacterium]
MITILQQLILQVVLITVNAFFAATEISLVSVNEAKVRRNAEKGDKASRRILSLLENSTGYLSTIQIGITLAGFLASAFAADNFSGPLVDWLVGTVGVTAVSEATLDTVSVVLITLILSYFTLVLGELVPKRVAMRHAEGMARKSVAVISFLSSLLKPIVWFLTVSTNAVLRLFRIDPNDDGEEVSEEDILDLIDEGKEQGVIGDDAGTMIENVFAFDDVTAEDVLIPRTKMSVISLEDTKDAILEVIRTTGFSRLPVYGKNIDDIRGVLRVKDYLLAVCRGETPDVAAMLMPVHFVAETVRANVLFREMQKSRAHIVIVLDEYGGTAGLVTLEDLIEEVLGDIYDENEKEAPATIKILDENHWKIRGNAEAEEVASLLGLEDEDMEEFNT